MSSFERFGSVAFHFGKIHVSNNRSISANVCIGHILRSNKGCSYIIGRGSEQNAMLYKVLLQVPLDSR